MLDKSRRQAFDIAPQAPRHMPAAWCVLAAGLVVAGLCVWPLSKSLQSLRQASDAQNRAQVAQNQQAKAQRAAQLQKSEPAMLRQAKARQQLEHTVRMSWSGLFEALEAAAVEVRGGVSILALTPSTAPAAGASELSLTALAADSMIMLRYIAALRSIDPVRQVEVTAQQPDEKSAPGVIRFQLSVLWDPKETIPPAPVGEASTGAMDVGVRTAADPLHAQRAPKVSP